MGVSDASRLSVVIIDVRPGREHDFAALAPRLKEVLERKQYCVYAQTIRDEGIPARYYAVREWRSLEAARKSHSDREINDLRAELYEMALVTHVINGTQQHLREDGDDRRTRIERDRRAAHGHGGARRLLHHEHGCGRPAATA